MHSIHYNKSMFFKIKKRYSKTTIQKKQQYNHTKQTTQYEPHNAHTTLYETRNTTQNSTKHNTANTALTAHYKRHTTTNITPQTKTIQTHIRQIAAYNNKPQDKTHIIKHLLQHIHTTQQHTIQPSHD